MIYDDAYIYIYIYNIRDPSIILGGGGKGVGWGGGGGSKKDAENFRMRRILGTHKLCMGKKSPFLDFFFDFSRLVMTR